MNGSTRPLQDQVRSQFWWKNRKRIEAASLAVYIGAGIAYKHRDRPRGNLAERERNHMATKKKVRKSTKSLKKSKKLEATKPLLKWSGSAGGSDVPTGN